MPYRAKFHKPILYACICLFSLLAEAESTTKLYWGDTHLHTSYSPDASLNGNIRIGPNEAFRFARGEAIEGHSGESAKLKRPLDFLVVADHAEYLGLLPAIRSKDTLVMKNKIARRWSDMISSGEEEQSWKAMFEVLDDIEMNKPSINDKGMIRSVWDKVIASADRYNEPGKFTAFIGYEWTSMPGGNNLHRVVIFKDGAEKAGQVLPFSSFDSDDPWDLWQFLAVYETRTGGEVIAIPHNGNMSNGLMFQTTDDLYGKPMTRKYAQTRMRWEPLYEVTQIKGDGETHPRLSPEDEFADFETWDKGNLTATAVKEDWMLQYEYARSALKTGLQIAERIGVNPYQFGMIGSTDAHTGFATAREDNFWGKFSVYEPGLHRLTHRPVKKGKPGKAYDLWAYEISASGYAAVWATENTREALFAAMKRRETYATTGPRIWVRFFGGWTYTQQDAYRSDLAAVGYDKGVPMGGELIKNAGTKAPAFLLKAVKDPEGVKLERIQIIKGWLDEKGQLKEMVYDVAGPTPGNVELTTYWRDPDFDPKHKAFYYARILEIPKPRWTTLEAERFNTKFNGRAPLSIQDRAYTSPIWYTPIDKKPASAAKDYGMPSLSYQ